MTSDERARMAVRAACEANSTSVQIEGLCTCADLRAWSRDAERPVLILDCEGAERELLHSCDCQFSNARILVECHDFLDSSITADLMEKFSKSHAVQRITQSSRDPFSHPTLQQLLKTNDDHWVIMSERRPLTQIWLYMVPL